MSVSTTKICISGPSIRKAFHIWLELKHASYTLIMYLPVGWGACDHSVNQDAMCHIWEGWIPQLQLGNNAEAKGYNLVLVTVVQALF